MKRVKSCIVFFILFLAIFFIGCDNTNKKDLEELIKKAIREERQEDGYGEDFNIRSKSWVAFLMYLYDSNAIQVDQEFVSQFEYRKGEKKGLPLTLSCGSNEIIAVLPGGRDLFLFDSFDPSSGNPPQHIWYAHKNRSGDERSIAEFACWANKQTLNKHSCEKITRMLRIKY